MAAGVPELSRNDARRLLNYGHPAPMNAGGSFCPLSDRAGLLKEPDGDRALQDLREDLVRQAAGPLHDDAAMLLLRYHDHAEGKSVPIG